MQVTAYQDPGTGTIYGTEKEMNDAQAERAREAAAEAARTAATAAWKDATTLLLRELTDVRSLPELVKRMLDAWFEDEYQTMVGRKKRFRKDFVKPAVHALEVSGVELCGTTGIALRIHLAVTVSGSLWVYGTNGEGSTWSPEYALPPFSYAGGTSRRTVPQGKGSQPMERIEGSFRCAVSKLPAFQEVVTKLGLLLVKQSIHDGKVDALVEEALDANAQYTTLRDAACAASQALEEAKVAYAAAESAREQQEARVKVEVQASNPYVCSAELAKHYDAVGEVRVPTLWYLGING